MLLVMQFVDMISQLHDVVLWGATGQAKVINDALFGTQFKVVMLFDIRQVSSPLEGVQIGYGQKAFDLWLSTRQVNKKIFAAPAIGGDKGKDRLQLIEMFQERNLEILSVFHRTSFVAHDVKIEIGCQILAHSTVCASVQLGRAIIVNTASSVDHDCRVDDGVHIGPGARLSGEVTVNKHTFIGTGAVVLPRITIGENVIVGAGSVVTQDVPDNLIVVGNPARPYRRNK